MRVRFEKWEGLGNDFIVIRDIPRPLRDADVKRLCDRRFGVGADGVLLVETGGVMPRMVVRNADGSRPEMCGNGLRCVVGSLAQRGSREGIVIATDAGPKECRIANAREEGFDIEVEMGAAQRGDDLFASIGDQRHRFLTIDMGNPHAITFEPRTESEIDRIGPIVATLPTEGTNVEFCTEARIMSRLGGDPESPGPARIAVTVWERGVGRTLACGTGACAVAAVACDTGRARFGEPVIVALPGGELVITVDAESRAVRMRGPARRVYVGEVVIA